MSGDDLRRAFGHFATGVTVVTTAVGGQPHGLTVNAFCSLSLDPPQLLVCLSRANRSYAAFSRAEHFAVNVLSSGQAAIARRFASKADEKFTGIPYSSGRTGMPLIDGTLAWFECELVDRIEPAGTHTIVIGGIVTFGTRDDAALLFYRGRYDRLPPGS